MPHHVTRSSSHVHGPLRTGGATGVRALPWGLALGVAGLAFGCQSAGVGLEPRYVAVHNAMTAMGLSQTGAISEGNLDEGEEARLEVELAGGQCYTFMALGGRGTDDMGVQVLSEGGDELGRDLTHDRQAAAQRHNRNIGCVVALHAPSVACEPRVWDKKMVRSGKKTPALPVRQRRRLASEE